MASFSEDVVRANTGRTPAGTVDFGKLVDYLEQAVTMFPVNDANLDKLQVATLGLNRAEHDISTVLLDGSAAKLARIKDHFGTLRKILSGTDLADVKQTYSSLPALDSRAITDTVTQITVLSLGFKVIRPQS